MVILSGARFHRQYLLPCRHIFHLDSGLKFLTPQKWEEYISMFTECAMEYMRFWALFILNVKKRHGMVAGIAACFSCVKMWNNCTSNSVIHEVMD